MKNLKKLFTFVLTVLMLAAFSAFSVSAADFTVSVTVPEATVPVGGVLVVSVTVDSINTEDGLISVDVPLSYDDNVFECLGVAADYPEVWGVPENFSYSQAVNGFLWLRMLNDDDVFDASVGCSEGGVMRFEVTLRVKAGASVGTTEISARGNGASYIVCGALADGMCTPVYGTGNSILVEIVEGQGILGDVNGDGKTDNLDAAYVLKYDASLISLDALQLAMGDVNADGVVNSLDAALILKFDADLITVFPAQQ